MNTNNIEILPVSENDIDKLLQIESEQEIKILSYNIILSEIKNSNSMYYVAKTHDEILGYIAANLLFDHIDIDSVVVDKKYKRQGIASLLLKYILDIAKNKKIENLLLEVRISNEAAIKLYEKFGFKKIHVRKNYYTDNNEDALIYELNLLNI